MHEHLAPPWYDFAIDGPSLCRSLNQLACALFLIKYSTSEVHKYRASTKMVFSRDCMMCGNEEGVGLLLNSQDWNYKCASDQEFI